MMSSPWNWLLLRGATLLLIAVLLLGACSPGGSGGGIGGSGIRDTDISIGNVTGFGSVFINTTRFDTAAASIFVNGRMATESDLRVGMVVTAAVDIISGTASRIEYLPLMVGPVSASNPVFGSFSVFGLQVRYSESTKFDGLTVDELAPGQVLEISGYFDLSRTIEATFIRRTETPDNYLVLGTAGNSESGLIFTPGSIDDFLGDLNGLLAGLQINFEIPVIPNQAVLLSIPDANQPQAQGSVGYAAPPIFYTAGRSVNIADYVTTAPERSGFSSRQFQVLTSDETIIRYTDGRGATLSDIEINTRLVISGTVLQANQTLVADVLEIVE